MEIEKKKKKNALNNKKNRSKAYLNVFKNPNQKGPKLLGSSDVDVGQVESNLSQKLFFLFLSPQNSFVLLIMIIL